MQTEKLFCKQYVEVNPARRRNFKPRCDNCKKALKFVQRNNKSAVHTPAPVLPQLAHKNYSDKALIESNNLEALAGRIQEK